MIGQLFASIAKAFLRNKLLFGLSFFVLIAVLSWGVSRLKIDNDIYSIFPKGKEFQEFTKIIQENNLNKQLVFSFDSSEDEDQNFERLEQLKQSLESKFDNQIGNVQIYRLVDQGELIDYLQTVAIGFLEKKDYERIEKQLHPDSIQKRLISTKERLSGANSLFMGDYFAKDPLNLLGTKLLQFNVQSDSSIYEVENGVVYSKNKEKVFFFADLLIDSKDNAALETFDRELQTVLTENKDINLDVFGVYQIALANSKQIQKDTKLTSIVSVTLILLVLLIYYRSLVVPIFFLLPAFFGILCGLGMTGFFLPNINAISLATASVLLGIVLDYAFHFYTHYKHSGDVVETVREIGSPMIVGSFTTVAAFAALLWTDSIVLKNFGLIALFTLLGAALFTLTVLPVIIQMTKLKLVHKETQSGDNKQAPKIIVRLALLTIVAFTTWCLLKSTGMNFDGDLNNLSYHPKELVQKEKYFTGIQPDRQKRIYLFSSGETADLASQSTQQVFDTLVANKKTLEISEFISVAPYVVSNATMEAKENNWIEFWNKHRNSIAIINQQADNLGFSETAFESFKQTTEAHQFESKDVESLRAQLGLNRLIHQTEGKYSMMTSVVLPKEHVEELKQMVQNIDNVYILDIGSLTSNLLVGVKNDFNFLLYFSSSIVFLSLLVVYGRVELALFAFLPMFLSWIWIIGITSYFGIAFNFVNIIITTFIFGLGDDYSIFVTDGLLQRYKTKRDNFSSYRSAIILSAVTTIIGTGALIFAKHPSIHSIALISVIGIGSILLITLFVQPVIFNWFVTRRVKRKRGPITFFIGLYSIVLFIYFFIGSLFLTCLLICFVIPFPVSRIRKQNFMNYMISKLAKSTLYAGVHIKKQVLNPELLDYSKPAIIVANHTSFLDILAVLMLHPKTIIMVKSWVYNSPVFGPFIRYSGYIFAENGTTENYELIKRQIELGYSLVIFPEGTRSTDGEIHRFHKGAFVISRALNIPIQPILLVGLHEINPKNDIMINPGELYVKPLSRVTAQPDESDKDFTRRVQNLMRQEFKQAKLEHAKSTYWRPSIIQNYVFKGPVLEWYVRVKYALERKNFEYYDELITDKKAILDVGCGYGYLSYYLHYRNPERVIVGVDYDEEKILIADNAMKKNDNLKFIHADLQNVDFANQDVIFFNDVLHYVPSEIQFAILQKAVDHLNAGGLIFVRDGVVDREGIENTKKTELLSIKLLKFNKAEFPIEFLSISKIQAFCTKNKLTLTMLEHSEKTSNTLFILRK